MDQQHPFRFILKETQRSSKDICCLINCVLLVLSLINTTYIRYNFSLCSQILGHKRASNADHSEATEMDTDCDISEKSWALVPVTETPLICISDINLFKQNLTLFPISKIY
jgi:hypothetical protein